MPFTFNFPDIGEGIHEGKLLEWYVKPGDKVKEGASLIKVETDKVVDDIPCPKTGTIIATHGQVGEIIHVGNPLVEIQLEGETASAPSPAPKSVAPPAPNLEPLTEGSDGDTQGVVGLIEVAKGNDFLPATGEGMEVVEQAKQLLKEGGKALASPVARKMAQDMGLDIHSIKGTGPAGRVMKEDVQKASQSKEGSAAPFKLVPTAPVKISVDYASRVEYEELSTIRKTIAAKMSESKFTAVHTTAFEEVEISKLIQLRADQKEKMADMGIKLSYMPFIIKALTTCLKNHRKLNCKLDLANNRVIYNHFYNIGLAVDTPDGLMVPVIKDADTLSIAELANTISDLAERARARKISLSELRDGTFTITNYGSIAGTYGLPVINYPEVAIMGIGRIQEKPVIKNGQIVIGNVLNVSMSVDHRIVDGADAARFINDFLSLMSDPVTMLMM